MTVQRRTFLASGLGAAAVFASQRQLSAAEPIWGIDGWHRWRGPYGNNVCAPGATAPTTITPDHYRWKVPVPGRGHSSPIVTDDSVYLTTAEKDAGTQSVLAFDRERGRSRWSQLVHRGGLPTQNHPKNTEASSTLAFDGEYLYAVFYNASSLQLTKLTAAGRIVWQQNLGHYDPQRYKYGYAASPLLYEESVIVVGDYDGAAFLTARDRRGGGEVWRIERPTNISFSSPIVARCGGREQLLLSGSDRVCAYDPRSGRLLWETPCTTAATCGTMVWDDRYVYASGGYPKNETVCLEADRGRIVWTNNQKCYEQSMLLHDGFLYAVADSGVAYCWRGADGETMWRQRLGGDYSSSPLLVGGKTIHVFNEQGEGFAFAASPQAFRSLGKSKVGDEVFATPSVVGDTMYLRTAERNGRGRQEYLLAIA
jgi:hypothetical protein